MDEGWSLEGKRGRYGCGKIYKRKDYWREERLRMDLGRKSRWEGGGWKVKRFCCR